MSRKKPLPFTPPAIEPGMCGTCRHWHRPDDDETAECAVLAITHQRGDHQKRRIPMPDTTWMGDLETLVHERTAAATDGWEWRREEKGTVVEAERFSGVPREYIDLTGKKQKVWEPLRTYGWATCSRYEKKGAKAA